MVLVTDIYAITKKYPAFEQFTLISQTRRSAISVPSNIAEGYGKNLTSDYIRFLRVSCGSLYELQTQVEIAANLNYIPRKDFEAACKMSNEIAKMIGGLIKKLECASR
jgi:four helix bundle protein